MRRVGEVTLLTLALVLASMPALALPSPPSAPFLGHAPIVITSDANFTAANGVRAGSGTPSDPYVISGWSFTTAGVGIRIEGSNVTASWIVRENAFTAGTGISIKNTGSVGVVDNNQFIVSNTGVYAANADPLIINNSFIGNVAIGANGKGVDLATSNARVESNAFMYLQFGIRADRGTPSIICNDIHDDVIVAGIQVKYTTNALIDCNIMTQCTLGIDAYAGIGTIIVNNTVEACYGGIRVDLTKDVTVAHNNVTFSLNAQIKVSTVSGVIVHNNVTFGRAEAVVILGSPVIFAYNNVTANLGAGVRFEGTSGTVRGNVVSNNSIGIKLTAGSMVGLDANVVSNNTIQLDIPYESRAVYLNMTANIVNGLNVDGTINASQKVFFYHASNVSIQGRVVDGGFSAGYYGSISAQGQVVLYEVNTAEINGTVIAHGSVGISVVNSFNVNINDSLLVSNLIGVKAEVRANVNPVPNCVVSVKRTNITIPVDPVATAGIAVTGCLAIVANVTVSIVDIGIKVDTTAGLFLSNTTVFNTRIGLEVAGRPNMTNISGNVLIGNRIGARLSGTVGVFADNVVQHNAEIGVRLENGARLDLLRNNISFNGAGIVDMEVCSGPMTCSSLDARNNSLIENKGDGARVHGVTSWRGDVALGNEEDGFQLSSSAKMRAVVAAGNLGDGARVTGKFEIRNSAFDRNAEDGLDITGEGQLWDSSFTHNGRAGIRVVSTYVDAWRINASFNFDGILASENAPGPRHLPPPTLPGLMPILWGAATGEGALGPFNVHLSSLIGNQRDSIRAGYAIVNATHNYFGDATGPRVNVADTAGAFQNGVSPMVRFLPYWADAQMTTTGPVPNL